MTFKNITLLFISLFVFSCSDDSYGYDPDCTSDPTSYFILDENSGFTIGCQSSCPEFCGTLIYYCNENTDNQYEVSYEFCVENDSDDYMYTFELNNFECDLSVSSYYTCE